MDAMMKLPQPLSVWLHDNGTKYTVLMLSNMTSERMDYPKTVTYCDEQGNVYSKELALWHRSRRELVGEKPSIAIPDVLRTLVWQDVKERLQLGPNDEAAIGAYELLHELVGAAPKDEPAKDEPEWLECQRISSLPAVDEAIRGLLDDPTGDNATMVVREVVRAVRVELEPCSDEGCDFYGKATCEPKQGGCIATLNQPQVSADNLRLLQQKAIAFEEWSSKTDWVQDKINTFPTGVLGKHRADVMREEIERLRGENALHKRRIDNLMDPRVLRHRGNGIGLGCRRSAIDLFVTRAIENKDKPRPTDAEVEAFWAEINAAIAKADEGHYCSTCEQHVDRRCGDSACQGPT